jgi:hypothetical protein
MPHEMGRCYCGREIHWPRDARYGDRWRCYQCGRTWTLLPDGWRGQPTKRVKSRRQAPKPQVVVVQVTTPPRRKVALPVGSASVPALPPPPPPRRGFLAWLLGE